MRDRPLRMALVGGGPDSLIGPVHRMAAELDRCFTLVAGAFSADAANSKDAAVRYGLPPERGYASYQDLLASEPTRPDSADLVVIATPNYLHFPIACAALRAGLHVLCDKPGVCSAAQASVLRALLAESKQCYGVTFTYTGYPLERQARFLCRSGQLGTVRKVVVEYSQGWLSEPIERSGQRQALWRTDPAKAGPGGCIGDIGLHAFNLLEYVTGRQVVELCADLSSIVSGRRLDDDCNLLLRLDNGAPALLHASQIATGERNALRIHVFGERGGMRWDQDEPERLHASSPDGSTQTLHRGSMNLHRSARVATRLPLGHPEGFIEALANIYRDFSGLIWSQDDTSARRALATDDDLPEDQLQGIDAVSRAAQFVEVAVANSRARRGWSRLD